MLTHMKAVHKDTSSERTSLDFPVRLALFQIREGDDADANQSTQGKSHGQINSPKVVSEGRFVCSVCDKNYPKKDEVLKHIADDHGTVAETMEDAEEDLTGDEEVLEEACELYEALEAMTLELYEDDADESKKEIIRKLERFMTLVKKKTQIQKDTNDEVSKLKQVEEDLMKDIGRKKKDNAVLKRTSMKEN